MECSVTEQNNFRRKVNILTISGLWYFLFTFHRILVCTVSGPVGLLTTSDEMLQHFQVTVSKNWSQHPAQAEKYCGCSPGLWSDFIPLMLCWHYHFGLVSGTDLASRHRFTAVHSVDSPWGLWDRKGLNLQCLKQGKCKLFHTSNVYSTFRACSLIFQVP